MTQRYYLDPDQLAQSGSDRPPEGAAARLTDAEAHHFLHVMRGKPGDAITLFDGLGRELQALVTATNRREVELKITASRQLPLELPVRLDLAVALPKGDRSRYLVEKLTELGAASLTPLITLRGPVEISDKALEKLRRGSIEACKQSGRNRLLRVGQPRAIEPLDASLPAETLRMVAHPGPEACSAERLLAEAIPRQRPVAVMIGPEGGLTDDELATAVGLGWQPVSLGPRILRIETAAVALTALVALLAESSAEPGS